MPKIRYEVAGVEAVEEISPDLVPFYEGRPGYTIVVDELAAAVLKGDDLDQAARELAGITDPGHTPADEKRARIVAATAPTGDGLPPHGPTMTEYEFVNGLDTEAQQSTVPATGPYDQGGELPVPATIVAGADGIPVLTPDPEPSPARTTKRRTAADKGE